MSAAAPGPPRPAAPVPPAAAALHGQLRLRFSQLSMTSKSRDPACNVRLTYDVQLNILFARFMH